MDVKTVQTRLGHANPSITLGWYAHAIPENDRAAADMLGNLFGNTNDEEKPSTGEVEVNLSKVTARDIGGRNKAGQQA